MVLMQKFMDHPYPHTHAELKCFLNITSLQKTGDLMDIAGEAKVYANFQEVNPRYVFSH